MRTPEQMRAYLEEYPDVQRAADELMEAHGPVVLMPAEDYGSEGPSNEVVAKLAQWGPGTTLASTVDSERLWLIAPDGEIADLKEIEERISRERRERGT